MTARMLSNLRVLPSLLPGQSPRLEILRCTVGEMIDFARRHPDWAIREALSPQQRDEYHRLTGATHTPAPRLTEARPSWLAVAAASIPKLLGDLEQKPTREAAFGLLAVTRLLVHEGDRTQHAADAAGWDDRVCAVLARREFRFTPDMIDQRAEAILGFAVPRAAARTKPAPAPAPEPAAPEPTPAPVSEPAAAEPLAAPVPPPPAPNPEAAIAPPPAPDVSPAPAKSRTITDPDLIRVCRRWPTLPDSVKTCILMLIDAADATRGKE